MSDNQNAPLKLLSIVIPARDEEGCIAATVESLCAELQKSQIAHEIIVIDDGSRDGTWEFIQNLSRKLPQIRALQNLGPHGFGRTVQIGLEHYAGDAVIIMMADESDSPQDAVLYWQKLNEGYDCVFGSRFIKGG